MARYTIDFENNIEQALRALSKKKHVSKAEIIRRALASYKYLIDNVYDSCDRKVSITDNKDRVLKDIVLP